MASRFAASNSCSRWVTLGALGASFSAFTGVHTFGCAGSAETPYGPTATSDGGGGQPGSGDGAPPPPGVTPDGSLGNNVGGGDDGGGGSTDCPAGAGKYIYVVSDQNDLYTFDPTLVPTPTKPTSNPFTKLGPLNCPPEITPPVSDNDGVNSMAVDRQAIAWVNFNDGKIFKVDTTQASLPCTDTGYVPGQGGFTPQLGMGFVTASATDHTERLYVSDNTGPGGSNVSGGGKGLGWIDTNTMKMTATGPWVSPQVAGFNAELSGTGSGLLYGFFTTSPSDLGQIDKTSAAVSGITPLGSVNNSQGGYAFSFWGADFWIYTAFPTNADPNATTSVTHFVSADGGVGVVMPDIGFTIVGAGSSTCVPTVAPPPPK
jgi:hypothetical protein